MPLAPERHWLITWTAFGTWLPGDRRGSTSPFRTGAVTHERMNAPGEVAAPSQPALEAWTRRRVDEPPVRLTASDAQVLLRQFHETARIRGWVIRACAVMHNHVHVVVATGAETPSFPCSAT